MLTLAMVAAVTACAPAQGGGSDEPVEFAEMAAAAESGPAVGMGDRVFAHLGQFQAIADLNGGTRASGSAGHAAALDYVESVLRDAGYETVRVTLDAEHPSAGAADVTVLSGPPSDPGEVIAMVGSPVAGSLTAPLLATTDPTGCTASDYAQADSSIVLVQRGRCSFADKAHLAERAGALAVLVQNDAGEGPLRGDLAGRADVVPALGLTHEAGDALRAGLRGGEVVVRVTVDPGHETVPVTNLLAQRPDGAADPVLVGAHLDSVAESPGINDNASGVSVALAVAEELAARGAPGARFAFWDGTEQGVLGSTAYVQALDQAAKESLAAYLNLDTIASPFGDIGIHGTGAPAEALLDAVGPSARLIDVAAESDDAPFTAAGIPAAGVHSGSMLPLGLSGEIFDMSAAVAPDPCYHRACDTLSAVDTATVRARLGAIADATVAAVADLSSR